MKVSWVIIVLMSATNIGLLDGSITLGEMIESKCISNGQSKDHIMLAFNKTNDCIKNSPSSELPHPILDHEKFCKYLSESQFNVCTKIFITDFFPCLNETETYIQHFILNAISSGYNEVCGSSGLSNLKYYQGKYNQTEQCLTNALFMFMYGGLCVSDIAFIKNLDNGVINLNKKDICFDLNSIHNCTTQVIEGICKNKDFSRFIDLLFRPFTEECQEFSETNSVLIK